MNFEFTNPDRIFYPEQQITKLDLAEYYQKNHEWILPYIINRPLTLLRCPKGYDKKCFYQKHLHSHSEALFDIHIKEKEKTEKYIYIKNQEGLMELVQLGVLEIHPWECTIDEIEKPDMLIFDLDPAPDLDWKKVIKAAHFVRDQLELVDLKSFVRTTGGKGLHVVVPIQRRYNWDEIKSFTKLFVEAIVMMKPSDYVGTITKSKRTGKVFIDYLRNQRGATAIASYSTRARENATVATPLSWDELSARTKPTAFTVETVPRRLAKLKKDPWEDFFKTKQGLSKLKKFF